MIETASEKSLIDTKNFVTSLDKKLMNSINDESSKLKENLSNSIKINCDQVQENVSKNLMALNARINLLET